MDSLEIAHRLRENNRGFRFLFPDYDTKVVPVREIISNMMKENSMDVLPATLALMQAAADNGKETHILWFASAAVDIINDTEPHV